MKINFEHYDKYRFIHYYQQLKHILVAQPKNVLEIGPGDNLVRDFLVRCDIPVKTIDIDPEKNPNICGDFRTMNLAKIAKADVVLCSEVLEHFNFNRWFEESLKRLAALSKRRVILSLPLATIRLFGSKGRFFGLFGCDGIINTHIPWFFLHYPQKSDKDFTHHWEIGKRHTSLKKVKQTISKYFIINSYSKYYNTNCVIFDLTAK
jgi:hypothetical protein